MNPTLGRIVLYKLREDDALKINKRRGDASRNLVEHIEKSNGVQIHVGNGVEAGQTYPMVITRVWGGDNPSPTSLVNGQLMLDGNDLFWVTSVGVGDSNGSFSWPTKA